MGAKTYKVIKLLSSREKELVINAGIKDHISPTTVFEIYEMGDDIVDPETKESLGKLEITKGRVEVKHIQENFCIVKAATYTVQRSRHVSGMNKLMGGILGGHEEHWQAEVKEDLRLGKTDDDYDKRLMIRVGDLARIVG